MKRNNNYSRKTKENNSTKNISIIVISSQECLKMKNTKRFLTPCTITGLPRIGTVNYITTAQNCFPFQFQ